MLFYKESAIIVSHSHILYWHSNAGAIMKINRWNALQTLVIKKSTYEGKLNAYVVIRRTEEEWQLTKAIRVRAIRKAHWELATYVDDNIQPQIEYAQVSENNYI